MKILRNIGKSTGVLILSFSLISVILMIALVKLTDYDNIKSFFNRLFEDQFSNLDENDLIEFHTMLLIECQKNDVIKVPVSERMNVTLNCKDVNASSPHQLPRLIGENTFKEIYYYEYGCEFLDCLKNGVEKSPLPEGFNIIVLFSNKSNSFFKSIQKFFWIGVGLGIILILVSVERWENRIKVIGITLLFIGGPMLIFWVIKDFFIPPIPQKAEIYVTPVIDQFFSFIFNSFLIVTIIGVVLTISAYLLIYYQKRKQMGKIN